MSFSSSAMLRSRESERCRYPASRIIVAAGSARVPLLGSATRSIGFLLASANRRSAVKRIQRGADSEVLVDVCEVQAAPDHDDLGAVEKLGDLLGERVVRLVLGGQPDLAGLLEELLSLGVHPGVDRGHGPGSG